MVRKLFPKAIRDFLATESASGFIMMGCGILAFILANSPLEPFYKTFVDYPIRIGIKNWQATHSLTHWVKDVLMVFFFLIVALELKREMVEGCLAQRDKVLLPLFAALGGMIIPALIFFFINQNAPEFHPGWAIPCATDIAFALCILMLVGKSVSSEAKIFLLAIAIFDDIGAIIIIALFYNTDFSFAPLLWSFLGVAALILLNRFNVTNVIPYLVLGIFLWGCFHSAGIHTTVAGVIVGMSIPMKDKRNKRNSPLNNWMDSLHPWVSFFILPLFALTSAGVNLNGVTLKDLLSPLPLGIALGLFLGKQIGIFGTTFLLIKSRIVSPLTNLNWKQIYGVSVIAGIGFTMSLFINLLAFNDNATQDLAKLGVIIGSLLSTLWGYIILRWGHGHKAHHL